MGKALRPSKLESAWAAILMLQVEHYHRCCSITHLMPIPCSCNTWPVLALRFHHLRYKDCNGVLSDGCEVNLYTDPNNCGACNAVVSLPNVATPTCTAGKPSIGACSPG
jgi:hypothetical protein